MSGHRAITRSRAVLWRTYLTKNLTDLAAEVIRRLSGDHRASAVFNMATQFGGGTHALTLLYHLARVVRRPATGWVWTVSCGQRAKYPQAATAVPRHEFNC